MIDKLMAHDLNVDDFCGVDVAQALPRLDGDARPLLARGRIHGAAELEREGGVAHRLHDEVDGAHLIAFDGVLGHVGHEDDLGGDACLAQHARRIHAIDLVHLDVEQDDVLGGAGGEELLPVRIAGSDDLLAPLIGEALDHASKLAAHPSLIIDDRDPQHAPSSSRNKADRVTLHRWGVTFLGVLPRMRHRLHDLQDRRPRP